LGSGLVDLAAVFQQRDDQVSRSLALTDWTQFETDFGTQYAESKRNPQVDATNFPQAARENFDKAYGDFIKSKNITDPRLIAELGGKKEEYWQRVSADSYDFKYKQQDALVKTGLEESVQTWRNRIHVDKTLLPEALKDMAEKINAAPWDPAVKLETAQLYRTALEAAALGKEEVDISRKGATSGPPPNYSEGAQSITNKLIARSESVVGVKLSPGQAAVVAGNMQQESGFRTWAHNEKEDAHGLIQWRLSRWDALRDAAATAGKDWRDPNFQVDFFLREFKEKYPRSWHKFMTATSLEEMNAAMKQYILYGDDSQGTRLANAKAILAGGNLQADLAARDDTTPADRAALDSDPRYMTVPLEQRIALRNAADAQASEEASEAAKAASAAVDAKLNDLFVGLHDRMKNETDVLNARKEGWLSEFDDINKADQILGEVKTETAEAEVIQSTLENNGEGYNRVTMNGEKNKGVNAWVGKEGLDKITARDDEYMEGTLLPAVGKWDDIPTVVVGQLESMAASNDTASAVWALEQLQKMKDIAPNGFISRTTENRLGERVESFRNLRGLFKTNEEMLSYVNGGTTHEAARVMTQRDEQARKNLNALNSKAFLNKVLPSWNFLGTRWGEAYQSENYEVTGALEAAGRELYIYNFRTLGDHDKAIAATKKRLGETWGLSTVADSTEKVPMEWPPEKVYAGTKVPMEVYADQIRRAFNLTDDEGYRLISDDKTYQEIGLAGRGQLVGPDGKSRLPSYRVKRITKNGNEVDEGRWFGDPVAPVEETE
jgi:hypothetical protein